MLHRTRRLVSLHVLRLLQRNLRGSHAKSLPEPERDPVAALRAGPSALARTFAAGFAATISSWVSLAHAEPQGRVAARTGLCGAGDDRGVWQGTRWCNTLTGDLLFLRQRERDIGLGPYVELGTAGFWDVRWGGGGSVLLPVSASFPLVVSVGVDGHALRSPALALSLFLGARSYNFDGAYNYSLGIYTSAYRDLGAEHASLISAGLELDGFFFAAPLLFAWSALR